jgi:hypothetical protein
LQWIWWEQVWFKSSQLSKLLKPPRENILLLLQDKQH